MIYDREGDEHDGREPGVEDEGAPTGDDEPSLGWTTSGVWGSTSGSDREIDNCDREDSEPLLTEASDPIADGPLPPQI